MMKSSTSLDFSSSLLFFFVASTAVYSQIVDDCVYMLSLKTRTVAEAGTNSSFGVEFGDEFGESVKIPDLLKWGNMPPGHEYFQQGNLDFFLFRAPCLIIHLISWINVTSDGSGQKPKRYLENVKASIFATPLTKTKFEFEYIQWFAIVDPPYKLPSYELMASLRPRESDGLSTTWVK